MKVSVFSVTILATFFCTPARSQVQYNEGDPANAEVDIGARGSDSRLAFNSDEVIVNPGEPLKLDCGVDGEFRHCHWEKDDKVYQLLDVKSNMFSGIRATTSKGNECAITINPVSTEHHGVWTCRAFITGNALRGEKNVVVTIKPTNPRIEGIGRPYHVSTLEEPRAITCTVEAARPPPTIDWYLGDTRITSESVSENTPTNDQGVYKSISTLNRHFTSQDNGQKLRCLVEHQTLNEPIEDAIDVIVKFPPTGASKSFYEIQPGQEYEVRMDFSSNPSPSVTEWQIVRDGEIVKRLTLPGHDDRYSTQIMNYKNASYTAILKINPFSREDTEQVFSLLVTNEMGSDMFQALLSMDEAPIEPLSTGAIVAIVVIVLVVVVVLITAVYMRYRHLYCFTPRAESKAYIQDPERPDRLDNGTGNDAVKISSEHVNGRTDNAGRTTSVVNGNRAGNFEQTRVDHHHHPHPHHHIEEHSEKKNTDV